MKTLYTILIWEKDEDKISAGLYTGEGKPEIGELAEIIFFDCIGFPFNKTGTCVEIIKIIKNLREGE